MYMNIQSIFIPAFALLLLISLSIFLSIAIVIFFLRLKFHSLRQKASSGSPDKTSIAFFHPHCAGGGGGERVLWKAIESISQLDQDEESKKRSIEKCRNFHVVVYTSDAKKDGYYEGTVPMLFCMLIFNLSLVYPYISNTNFHFFMFSLFLLLIIFT